MTNREEIIIFDDGSIASRLLQHELKDKYDIKTIGVNVADNVLECFAKIQPDKKVHLHYTYEQYAENHEQLRKDIQKVESLGFKNLVVLDYEGLDQKTLLYRAGTANIEGTKIVDGKTVQDDLKESKYSGKSIVEDIKLTGKPEAIAIDLPTDIEDLKDLPSNQGIDKPIYNKNSYTDYIPEPKKDEEDKSVKKSRFRKKFV